MTGPTPRDARLDAERLIAFLARRAVAPGTLAEGDWERIIALAVQEGVGPVLYSRLKERACLLPRKQAEQLRRAYLANAARNIRLFHELGTILRTQQAASVSVILLKGAFLAEAAYGDIALRPMADLDLWVQRYQLDAARSVMQTLGYASRSQADRPLALQDALTGETQMFNADASLVELHWNVFPGEWVRHTTQIDEGTVWGRSLPLDGGPTRRLSPEDTVIHLCVHLAVTHQMSGVGLRTLVDLDYARRKWTIDWKEVAQRTRAWRVSCATWLVLHALAELFGDPEHELPLAELAPSRLRQSALARFASPRLFAEGLDLSSGPMRFLFLLSLVDRPRDAAFLVWRALFPDRLWLTLRYESPNASAWRICRLRAGHLLNLATRREV